MSAPVRRSDIGFIGRDSRRVGEVLLHNCGCGRTGCTIGEHIWLATRDMAPGLKAQNTDPKIRAWPADTPDDDHADAPIDGTAHIHDELRTLLQTKRDTDDALFELLQNHRPDRTVTLITPTDEIWCRSHLRIGRCEPRHRIEVDKPGPKHTTELCRWCRDFRAEYHIDPPVALLKARHDGQRITQQMVDAAILAERKEMRRKRRKAS